MLTLVATSATQYTYVFVMVSKLLLLHILLISFVHFLKGTYDVFVFLSCMFSMYVLALVLAQVLVHVSVVL